MLKLDELINYANKIEGQNVAVIGDLGIDEYVMGQVNRISPEAPVPVVDVRSEDKRLGLSANVAANIKSLGGVPYLIGIVGDDLARKEFCKLLAKESISDRHLVVDADRPTTRKLRIIGENQQIVRVDFELKKYISDQIEKAIMDQLEKVASEVKVVVLQDYAKGTVSKGLAQKVIDYCKAKDIFVMVDPHRQTPLDFYQNASLIKPNRDEAIKLSGLDVNDLIETPETIKEVGRAIKKLTNASYTVVTEGSKGIHLFADSGETSFPTYAREVFDVTGAGDTVIATMAMGYSAGVPMSECCELANYAAGVVVSQVGCVSCSLPELTSYIQKNCKN